MYLLSQLWWYLTLAFLLGALLGYLFWRACSRPLLETRHARTQRALNDRIGFLESQGSAHGNVQSAAMASARAESSAETSKLMGDLAALKTSRDEFISRANTLADSETRLKSQLGDAEKRLAILQTDFAKARSEVETAHAAELKKAKETAEAEAARKHSEELNKAREAALAEWSAKQAADVKKAREDAIAELTKSHTAELKKAQDAAKSHESRVMALTQTESASKQALDAAQARHNEELKKARDAVTAEWTAKHAADVKKTRDEVTAQLGSAHAAEVQKLQETAKAHETKVLALSASGASAMQDLDAARARHSEELKKARETAEADAARRHADDLKKVREQIAAEHQAKHADELKRARDAVAAEWTAKHAADLKKAREDVTAQLNATHAAEMKKLEDTAKTHETKVLALSAAGTSSKQELEAATARHNDELKKMRDAEAEAARKHAEEVRKAREHATAELNAKHADELKKARDAVAAEWTTKHAADLKKTRDEVTAQLASAHAAEVQKLQETAKAHETKVLALSAAGTSAKQELDAVAARHNDELKKMREAEENAARKHAEDLRKARDAASAELNAKHQDELRKARDAVAAEWTSKHNAEAAKVREGVTSELGLIHAAEVKRLQDVAKGHEAKVLSLTQADATARQEIEAAKARHAEDLKKTREAVAAEWSAKHDAGLKKIREETTSTLIASHAAEIARARTSAFAEAGAKHTEELKQATDKVMAEWKTKHQAELEKAREQAASDAARRHADEVARLKREHDAALAKHAEDLASARRVAAMPVAAMAQASHAASDDLELIWGVGPGIAKLLHGHGVTRFEQIANWSEKDIIWLDGVLPNFKGRAVSEKWVEQAKKLASGWRPERSIGDRPQEILTGPRGGKADDLKLIWGVGPKLEQVLNEAGFYHFDQIAKWTDKEIAWVDSKLGEFAGRAVRDKWVEQCKKLAAGWRPDNEAGEKPH